jgi:hypothetical protein
VCVGFGDVGEQVVSFYNNDYTSTPICAAGIEFV